MRRGKNEKFKFKNSLNNLHRAEENCCIISPSGGVVPTLNSSLDSTRVHLGDEVKWSGGRQACRLNCVGKLWCERAIRERTSVWKRFMSLIKLKFSTPIATMKTTVGLHKRALRKVSNTHTLSSRWMKWKQVVESPIYFYENQIPPAQLNYLHDNRRRAAALVNVHALDGRCLFRHRHHIYAFGSNAICLIMGTAFHTTSKFMSDATGAAWRRGAKWAWERMGKMQIHENWKWKLQWKWMKMAKKSSGALTRSTSANCLLIFLTVAAKKFIFWLFSHSKNIKGEKSENFQMKKFFFTGIVSTRMKKFSFCVPKREGANHTTNEKRRSDSKLY